MMVNAKSERDIVDTENILFTLAGQNDLVEKRVILIIMEHIVLLWVELKMQISPYGNWEFTEKDRDVLHNHPEQIEALLERICRRALPVH